MKILESTAKKTHPVHRLGCIKLKRVLPKLIIDQKIWKKCWGCAVPSSAQLELAVYWLASFYRHSQLLLTLPTILNVLSWKINFQVWVVGWVGLLKNKATLSLNWF